MSESEPIKAFQPKKIALDANQIAQILSTPDQKIRNADPASKTSAMEQLEEKRAHTEFSVDWTKRTIANVLLWAVCVSIIAALIGILVASGYVLFWMVATPGLLASHSRLLDLLGTVWTAGGAVVLTKFNGQIFKDKSD